MSPAKPAFSDDPLSGLTAEVRRIQPYQAQKVYRCPGCNNEIGIGIGHYVIVPLGRSDERRHWHLSCWERRSVGRPRR